jgi:uncharacterized protein
VHPDVEGLLALQAEDQAIRELEQRLAAFAPRLAALAEAHRAATDGVARAQSSVETEERRQRELQAQIAKHKQLHERNLAQLDMVKKMRDATAAMAQVEAARRMLAEEESELQAVSRRLGELRAAAEAQQRALIELETQHASERTEIQAAGAEAEAALLTARGARAGSASQIDRILLSKYDRIRGARRNGAIFPLRGPSCGNCDTSVPMQRRNVMSARGSIEVCETCGVLLYAAS